MKCFTFFGHSCVFARKTVRWKSYHYRNLNNLSASIITMRWLYIWSLVIESPWVYFRSPFFSKTWIISSASMSSMLKVSSRQDFPCFVTYFDNLSMDVMFFATNADAYTDAFDEITFASFSSHSFSLATNLS